MRSLFCWRAMWCAAMLTVLAAAAQPAAGVGLQPLFNRMLGKVERLTGLSRAALAPDPQSFARSSTRDRQLPHFRELMAHPLEIPARVARVEEGFRKSLASPAQLMVRAAELAGVTVFKVAPEHALESEANYGLLCAADPLAAGMAQMLKGSSHAGVGFESPPDDLRVTWPLRLQIGHVLAAIGQSQRLRTQAVAHLPAAATPAALLRQLLSPDDGESVAGNADYRHLLSIVDRKMLFTGMLHLVVAVEALDQYLARTTLVPPVAWQWSTPMGQVIVDTTGANTERQLHDPLFIVDVGGDDTYLFASRSDANRIAVLLDRGGHDRYVAQAPAADPSSAVLGYGILWDSEGHDCYEGTDFAQSAALFGAALHVDRGGKDVYQATGFSQGFALGGIAVLLSAGGSDSFSALTHAQGAAGPEGVAVLIDTSGDDHYLLGNEPLAVPSSQLPDRNVSMGQGAGRGERATAGGAPASTGGIGMLLDLQGDDHYTAQVFAQGVGYYQGVGVLIDSSGRDVFKAAWYAMGASAHQAVGVLINRGEEDDRYEATHSTSLGAAHDFSVAFFVDEGGDDTYALGNLGLGAAHDNSVAAFLEVAGNDRYQVDGEPCDAFGIAKLGGPDADRRHLPGLGVFMDAAGVDRYTSHCSGPRDNAAWPASGASGAQKLRSERGAGMDVNDVHRPQ